MILKSFISDKLFCGKFYAGCGIFLRFCLYKLKNALYLHSLKKNVLLHNVKIAQLVEHDLAKVGVAGSSPVFRSLYRDARMVELVDTQDLKSCGHCGCAGSSPASSTPKIRKSNIVWLPFLCPELTCFSPVLAIVDSVSKSV